MNKRYATANVPGIGWAVVDTENGRKWVGQFDRAADANALRDRLNNEIDDAAEPVQDSTFCASISNSRTRYFVSQITDGRWISEQFDRRENGAWRRVRRSESYPNKQDAQLVVSLMHGVTRA
jgi:hypothetical protein